MTVFFQVVSCSLVTAVLKKVFQIHRLSCDGLPLSKISKKNINCHKNHYNFITVIYLSEVSGGNTVFTKQQNF